jgi:hypothetical protein
VIRRIADKLKAGTKFFIRHGEGTNSHDGREAVGEIVSTYTKEIDGRLSTIAIGHFPDESVVQDMDICSIETDVFIAREDEGIVGDIDEVSAVALESSERDSPAFPGATRLASIQCFDSGKEEKPKVADGSTSCEGYEHPSQSIIFP